MLKAEWEDWKSKRITSNGAGGYKRVQRDASTNYDTVSEGMDTDFFWRFALTNRLCLTIYTVT